MAEAKVKVCNAEWKLNIPKGPMEHNRVLEKTLHVLGGWQSSFNSMCKMTWRLGADDPRRILHSIKVGIALVLVSLFYFMNPLFKTVTWGMTVWSIMTVVVVFEFTAGATLSKGLNRMLATLFGGLLAVGTNYVAVHVGHNSEPIVIGAAVFLISAAATFARFLPKIKARYDYGVLIFVLSFSFMAISGYRVDNLFEVSYQRLGTIILGCILCILISLLIFPIWAGEDLHKLIIRNLEGLAKSLEGCMIEFFKESSVDVSDKYSNVCQGYKSILNSKASEESLVRMITPWAKYLWICNANFARWEPKHGQFGPRYPWMQYVKIGATMRSCAYCVEALNGCLNSKAQTRHSLREHLRAPCMNLAAESSKVLVELAESMKTMTRGTGIDLMTDRLNRRVKELQICLLFQPMVFIDSIRQEIMEETPQDKIVDIKLTTPSESENPQDLIRNEPQGRMGETNINPLISSGKRMWPREDLPVTMGDSTGAGEKKIQNYEIVEDVSFMDTANLATVACLLTEIVARLETVIKAVDELGEQANFTKLWTISKVSHLQEVVSIHVVKALNKSTKTPKRFYIR
eukprot:PITA_03297